MSVLPNDLFDPADFESISLEIHLKNLTNDKIVKEVEQITVIEVGDMALTLSMPVGYCFKGDHVVFEVYRDKKLLLTSTAKVEENSPPDEGISLIRLSLIQFDKKSWASFIETFSKRQLEIQKFFEDGKR